MLTAKVGLSGQSKGRFSPRKDPKGRPGHPGMSVLCTYRGLNAETGSNQRWNCGSCGEILRSKKTGGRPDPSSSGCSSTKAGRGRRLSRLRGFAECIVFMQLKAVYLSLLGGSHLAGLKPKARCTMRALGMGGEKKEPRKGSAPWPLVITRCTCQMSTEGCVCGPRGEWIGPACHEDRPQEEVT